MSTCTVPRRRRAIIDDPLVDGATIDRAIAAIGGVRPGDLMATSCTRIGRAKHVPPGFLVSACMICESPVWLSPEVRESAERHGMDLAIACSHCSGF